MHNIHSSLKEEWVKSFDFRQPEIHPHLVGWNIGSYHQPVLLHHECAEDIPQPIIEGLLQTCITCLQHAGAVGYLL